MNPPIFNFWHLSGLSGVMQRGFQQGPSSHLISCIVTSLGLGRGLHLAPSLCIDFELCVLDVSPGVVCSSHGVQRNKERRRNLRWAPIYIAQTQFYWHANCNQKLESIPAIVPATTFAENLMEPNPEEVRSHYWLRNCLKTHRASFQRRQIMLSPPWKKF